MDTQTRHDCPSMEDLEAVARGRGGADVVEHASNCPRCTDTLDMIRANIALADRLSASGISAQDTETPGAQRDDPGSAVSPAGYEVLDEIHRGAQGIVYRAVQRATRRRVALKLLLAGAFATSRQRRRFEREIDTAAGLRHPNVVTVYDSGSTADGGLFFAMELVEGDPLDVYLGLDADDRHAPPLRDVIQLFVKICSGVNAAHLRGLIHRDLKPANILIDAEGEPRIVDFGLAKLTSTDASHAQVTREGDFLGTLAYAAPEQTSGDRACVDTRSDVYALGVILYRALSGRWPYPVTGAIADVIRSILDVQPTPLRRSPARYRINDELETIVLRCLAKDPDRRYQTAGALGADLERYLVGQPIDAKRDSAWYVLAKAASRHRLGVGVAVAFLILLMASSIVTTSLYRRSSIEARKANQIRFFLEDTLGSVEPGSDGQDTTLRQTLDEAVHWVDLALADQPEIEVSIRTTIGNSYRSLGLLDRADEQLNRALNVARVRLRDQNPETARALNSLGLLRRDQGELEQADHLLREGLAIRRHALGRRDPSVAISLMNLASVRQATGDFDDARRCLLDAMAIRTARLGPDHPDVAMCLYRLGELARARGDVPSAAEFHRRALQMRQRHLDASHPDLARSRLALARLLTGLDRTDEAVDLARSAYESRSATLPKGHWRIAEARIVLGRALGHTQRFQEAEQHLRQGFETLNERLGSDDPRTLAAASALADLYAAWNRPDLERAWRESARAGDNDPG